MVKQFLIFLLIFSGEILNGGCNMKAQQQQSPADTGATMEAAVAALPVTSSAFQNDQPVPQKFSCDGENISPALAWGTAPKETKSFAMVCEDPDAPSGTF